jgi:hypothetical protein
VLKRLLQTSSSDGKLSSYETDFSDNDQGGHDNRRPKRCISTNDVGASKWTLEECRMLLTSGDASDSKDLSEDDGKLQIHMNPSKSKTQWSAAEAQRTISRSMRILQNRRKEAPFRALKLPESIDWLEPEVMKGKNLEDAEARANAASTCGFSALTCLKISRAHALKIDGLCKALPPLIGDPKEDATTMKAWRDSIRAKAKEWLHHIQIRSDVGAQLAASLFSRETQFIRQEVAKAPRLAPAKSILLRSAPTVTHLFSDNDKVRKAMEAADKHRPSVSKPPYHGSGSNKSWGTGAARTSAHQGQKPQQRHEKKRPPSTLPRRRETGSSASTSEARRPQVM